MPSQRNSAILAPASSPACVVSRMRNVSLRGALPEVFSDPVVQLSRCVRPWACANACFIAAFRAARARPERFDHSALARHVGMAARAWTKLFLPGQRGRHAHSDVSSISLTPRAACSLRAAWCLHSGQRCLGKPIMLGATCSVIAAGSVYLIDCMRSARALFPGSACMSIGSGVYSISQSGEPRRRVARSSPSCKLSP